MVTRIHLFFFNFLLDIKEIPHYGIDLWFRRTDVTQFSNTALYLLTDSNILDF